MSRGRPRLSVRLEPDLLLRVTERAQAEKVDVSEVLRRALAVYVEVPNAEGVIIPVSPYYHGALVKRLHRDYPRHQPRAVLGRLLELALDGEWLLTDREA